MTATSAFVLRRPRPWSGWRLRRSGRSSARPRAYRGMTINQAGAIPLDSAVWGTTMGRVAPGARAASSIPNHHQEGHTRTRSGWHREARGDRRHRSRRADLAPARQWRTSAAPVRARARRASVSSSAVTITGSTSASLYPAGPAVPVSVTVHNPGGGAQQIGVVHPTGITADAGRSACDVSLNSASQRVRRGRRDDRPGRRRRRHEHARERFAADERHGGARRTPARAHALTITFTSN